MSGVNVSVRGDLEAIRRDLNEIQRKIVPSVAASSLTTIMRQGRKQGIIELAAAIKIPRRNIAKRVIEVRASPYNLVAMVVVGLRNINPLYHYGATTALAEKQKGKRKAVALGRGQRYLKVGPFKYERAWITITKHGSPVILQRDGKPRSPYSLQIIPVRKDAVAIFKRVMGATSAAKWRPVFEQRLANAFAKRGIGGGKADRFLPKAEVV